MSLPRRSDAVAGGAGHARRRVDLAAVEPDDAPRLAALLAAARLVCFPTDTVYGVGGVVTPAVQAAIVAAKGRPADKPLQLVYPNLALLEAALHPEPRLCGALRRLLPGPFTVVLPYPLGLEFPPAGEVTYPAVDSATGVPARVRTLAVRVPAWPPPARALAEIPVPMLASSANPSGGAAPRSLDEVDADLRAACDLVLDAGPVSGIPSTIVDLARYAAAGTWRILRGGAQGEDRVAALLAAAAPPSGRGAAAPPAGDDHGGAS